MTINKGSISLLRTNPSLTANVKIIVDSDYKLYLESYNSNLELSNKRFKKFQINDASFISKKFAEFFKDVPTDIAFDIKNDIKSDTIQNTFKNQFDDIYFSGPRNVEDNRYIEEFQYNTTLKICPTNLPKYFFIFRINGPGLEYNNNIFENLNCIKTFDLTEKNSIGKL